MTDIQALVISEILGSMATDDGKFGLFKLADKANQTITIAVPEEQLMQLMQSTSNASGQCRKILDSDSAIKHIMDVEWWEVGGSNNNQNVVMSYRMPGGMELSFQISKDAAGHLHEALGVHLGIAPTDRPDKPTN